MVAETRGTVSKEGKFLFLNSNFKILTYKGDMEEELKTVETYGDLNMALALGYPIYHQGEYIEARKQADSILENNYLYSSWGEDDDLLIYCLDHEDGGIISEMMLLDKEGQREVVEKHEEMLQEGFLTFAVEEEGETLLKEEFLEDDAVNHPNHYNQTFLETMEKFLLMFHDNDDMIKGALLFNVLKYTDRAGHKDDKEQDEAKAKFYLDQLEMLYPDDVQHFIFYRDLKAQKTN